MRLSGQMMVNLMACGVAMSTPAVAQNPPARNFSGEYVMQGQGVGPGDQAYSGSCSVQLDGPAYRVSCVNQQTRHTYVGKGLALGETFSIFIGDTLRGDHNSVFTGEYLVVYHRRADGVLEGSWVAAQGAASGRETLSPAR
jgi:hypothetical protein